MRTFTLEATPLLVEIERRPADQFGENDDHLLVQVWRGNGFVVFSENIKRGEAADIREFHERVSTDELTRLNSLIAVEWLSWRDKTLDDLAPVKTTLELYEDLAKLVNAQKGAAA